MNKQTTKREEVTPKEIRERLEDPLSRRDLLFASAIATQINQSPYGHGARTNEPTRRPY